MVWESGTTQQKLFLCTNKTGTSKEAGKEGVSELSARRISLNVGV